MRAMRTFIAALAALLVMPLYAEAQTYPQFVQDFTSFCVPVQLVGGGPNGQPGAGGQNNFFWISGGGITAASAAGAHAWSWPAEWPQQFYIDYARVLRQNMTSIPAGGGGQIAIGVDRGGTAFLTGSPPNYQQNSYGGRWGALASLGYYNSEPMERSHFWNPPIFFNQATDLLWFQVDLTNGVSDSPCFEIGIEEPAPDVAATSVTAPPSSLTAIAGPVTVTGASDSSGWTNYTLALVVSKSAIVGSGGSHVQIELEAGNSGPWTIDEIEIGPQASSGQPYAVSSLTPVTFGGNPGITLGSGQVAMSDQVSFSSLSGQALVVKIHSVAGTFRYSPAVNMPGWQAYFTTGNDVATLNATGYTQGSAANDGVIAVYSAP